MNEEEKALAQYLKLNYELRYKNGNFVPFKPIVDEGKLRLEKYTDQILIYEPIQDNSSDSAWDLFTNKFAISVDDESEKFPGKMPLISKTDAKLIIPVLRITYFGEPELSTYKENYQSFLSREVLVGGFLIIKNALERSNDFLAFDRLKAHIAWSCWKSRNIFKTGILTLECIDSNGNPIRNMEALTNYLDQLYKFETATVIAYEKVVPVRNDNLFDTRLIPEITNYHREITMERWIQNNIHLNLPFWIKEYQLNHGMIITSYGLVPGVKPSLELSLPSIKWKKRTGMSISTLQRELLHSKIRVDDVIIEKIPFLTLFDTTPTNVIQCNILREEVVIAIWEQTSKPSQQLVKDINDALNGKYPYKSLTKVFSEYGHVICKEITMGERLASATVAVQTQEKYCRCLEYKELSEGENVSKSKDILKKFNIDNTEFISHDNSSKNISEINDWFNYISEKPGLWSLASQPTLTPLYEILDEEVKRQIQNLLENKQKILMTGITKLSSNETRYYRVDFDKYILTSDDYQIVGSVIMNNKRLENLHVKFRFKSIFGFSIIIKKHNSDEEIKGDLKVIWQLIGKPKSVGYFSNHTRNTKVFDTEFVIKIPEKKISHQIDVKEELSSGFIIATSIRCPPTNYEPMLQVIVKSWSEKRIDLDIIKHIHEDDKGMETEDTSEANDSDEASVQLYIINPNQQKFVIEDFGNEKVLWKLIGHELTNQQRYPTKQLKNILEKTIELGPGSLLQKQKIFGGKRMTEFVKRPGLGNRGRSIKVRTNFFEVTSLPDSNIYHYDVTITPDVPPAMNRKIYKHFEELHSESDLGKIKPVYDGRRDLYTAKPLPFGENATFKVILPENDGAPAGKRPPRSFNIKIKKVNLINMEELHRFLDGKGSISNNVLISIMALDVLIRHKPSMTCVTVGRIFYTNQGSKSLSGGVEVWQGYYQSARPTPNKMMINIDLSAAVFYESGGLVQLVVKILCKHSVDDLRRIQERDRLKLEKALKKLKIYVTHRGESALKRRFMITKLTSDAASHTKFEADGKKISVTEYFEATYDRILQYPFLPCVVVKKNIFLPMEVCNVVEGQRYIRKLNEKQVVDMTKFTCQPPKSRANKINQGLQILDYQQNEYMQQFGLKVSTEMAVVQARVLPTPKLQYHPSSRDASFVPNNGTWNLRDKKVVTGATLCSWACAVFGGQRDYPVQSVRKFLRELTTTCQDTGMNIPNKNPPIEYTNSQGNIEMFLRQIWNRAGNSARSKPQLILCVLPNPGVSLYAEIKRVSDTVIGVATQCIQGRHMRAAKKQYYANVCLKMNVKLGGINSFIDPYHMPFITQRPTILMGADVNHPPPGNQNRQSIAALCASMDAKASRYSASIRIQTGRHQEIIGNLAEMVKELLKTFFAACGRKPERILFYRNGISESQFAQALHHEISEIRAACKSLDATFKPTITFVVVQKRHHTRFFPMNEKDSNGTGNCLPGTVIESTITHPFEFDFYLQSHPGLQGTSRPTHYHVLLDENGFNSDSLQTLSYNLCYVYARCTRAVSLVPPVYYAHLVCSRARFHFRGKNWSDLDASEGPESANYAAVKPDLSKVMYYV